MADRFGSNTGSLCPGCRHFADRHLDGTGCMVTVSTARDRDIFCVCEMGRAEVEWIVAAREAVRDFTAL